MFFTLAGLVLMATVVVFFSEEFAGFIKKIFSIPGFLLLIPLAIASYVVLKFESYLAMFLYFLNNAFHVIIGIIYKILPFTTGALQVARIIFLCLATVLPLFILDWVMKRRTHRPFEYHYLIGSTLFIVLAFILLVI